MRLDEIAEKLSGRLSGPGDREITGVMPLAQAGPTDLSWLADPKYQRQLADTTAGAVLLRDDVAAPADVATITVNDPDRAMCEALALLAPQYPPLPPVIAASATVAADAMVADDVCIGEHVTIGPGARVGPRCQLHPGVCVGAGATIGADCVLWPNVVVREGCELGARVVIHPNTTIGADGFGYLQRDGQHVKIPQIGRVVIEDDVEIGANTAIDRARSGETRVGRGSKIDNLVQIGHNVRLGEGCLLVGQCGISGSVTLGKHVVLAGQVGVADHLKLADGVIVAAQGGVVDDLDEPGIYGGTPARPMSVARRQVVATQRLPDLVSEVRALRKRIEQLESSTND